MLNTSSEQQKNGVRNHSRKSFFVAKNTIYELKFCDRIICVRHTATSWKPLEFSCSSRPNGHSIVNLLTFFLQIGKLINEITQTITNQLENVAMLE